MPILFTLHRPSHPHKYQLRALVRAANPLLSFRELSVSTGIPVQHVHRLSVHLAYWGLARIVDTILTNNVYRIHPDADLASATLTGRATRDFDRQFKAGGLQPLPHILSFFRPGRRLQDILNEDVAPR